MMNVIKLLRKQGLRYKQQIEELSDHYMSQYESDLKTFGSKIAEQNVTNAIHNLNANELNKYFFSNHYKNKIFMLLSSLLVFAFYYVISPQNEPPSISPIHLDETSITSGFGQRRHPINKQIKHHNGIDLKGAIGTRVIAPSNGVIKDAGFDRLNGFYIEIVHDKIFVTRYHHLSAIDVKVGEKIKQGEKIGEVGSTGLSTAPHLHYEVIQNGKNVDPSKFIKV